MKRSWIGLGLLVLLLVVSLAASRWMVRFHEDASRQLEQAAELALKGQWTHAAFLTARVRHSWDRWQPLRTALADHGPLEDLEGDFALLELYGKRREALAFAAACRQMAFRMNAIGQAHSLSPENIL